MRIEAEWEGGGGARSRSEETNDTDGSDASGRGWERDRSRGDLGDAGWTPLQHREHAEGTRDPLIVLHVHPVSAGYMLRSNKISMDGIMARYCGKYYLEGNFLVHEINIGIRERIPKKEKQSSDYCLFSFRELFLKKICRGNSTKMYAHSQLVKESSTTLAIVPDPCSRNSGVRA